MRHPAAVAATRRAARSALARPATAPGDLVLVGVSGGADSLALAAAAVFEGGKLGLRIGAVCVDHGLQPGSATQASAAAAQCADLGLDPVETVTVAVIRRGDGPEAAARLARRQALQDAAHRLGAAAVLLGHTLDDQAETVLLGLARGSGARSLAGMAARDGLWWRPFLAVRRETTRAACAALGLAPWDDPHNDDPAYARVRARHDALPALEKALGPGVVEALARSAGLLADDADALDALAAGPAAAGPADTDLATLAAAPAAIRRRVLKAWAIGAGAPAGALTAAHLAAMDRLVLTRRTNLTVSLPGGLAASRACDRLLFR